MENITDQSGNSWSWKSEIYGKDDDRKKKLANEVFTLFGKLLFRAVILAIALAVVTGVVLEILNLF